MTAPRFPAWFRAFDSRNTEQHEELGKRIDGHEHNDMIRWRVSAILLGVIAAASLLSIVERIVTFF